MRVTAILLIRHGQTTWNREARYQGQREAPLSALGRRQAAALRDALAHAPLVAVYASPLSRSVETAEAIAAPHDLPVTVHPGLIEVGHGPFDGMRVSEIAERFPSEWAAWREDPTALRLPGAEPFAAVQARGLAALREISARHPDATAAAVTHGGLIRAVLLALLDAPPPAYWRLHVDNGGITTVEAGEGGGRIAAINATEHLAGLAGATVEE